MTKKYLKLTADQIARGVIFSSTLSFSSTDNDDRLTCHEVFKTQPESEQKRMIARLLDDKFFNDSPYKYNIVRK